MPFCPICKAEYCHGFYRCSDCDVELVESLDETETAEEVTFTCSVKDKLCELQEFFSEEAEFLMCSSCGCAVDETDEFCPACGERLEEEDE